jgi:hypothetical protein
MESFFQRVSSIVIKNSNKFFEQDMDDDDDDDHVDDDDRNERQKEFHYLAERRRSAPDIRRRAVIINRSFQIPAQKGTSDEQIATHFHTSILTRKHYNSIGKFFRMMTLQISIFFFVIFLKSF